MNWATVAPTSGSIGWSRNTRPSIIPASGRLAHPARPLINTADPSLSLARPEVTGGREIEVSKLDATPSSLAVGDDTAGGGQDVVERSSFVVVANRLPVDEVTTTSGGRQWRRSPGGLVTALHPVLVARLWTWVGWAGGIRSALEPFELDGLRLHPLSLDATDLERYYEGQSNATIWPLYHDSVETPAYRRIWRASYREVNSRFADAAAAVAEPGATVWVQDYQLQLVPAMLRERRPDLRIGFFLHIPFPPIELFMQMPGRAEILRGLLGADLVGFQQRLAAQNFLRLARHLLGLRYQGHTIKVDNRTVKAGAFPISIDVNEMEQLAANPAVQHRAKQIRAELGDPSTVLLGVDRLDYTKGIEL